MKNDCLPCSFCGKSQEEVSYIVAGPAVYICDKCVMACLAAIVDMGLKKKKDCDVLKEAIHLNEIS